MIYVRAAAVLALLAAFAWGAIADYHAGKKAGQDAIQTAWDKDKAAIQVVTDAAIAKATQERDTALQNNAEIVNDTAQQIISARNLSSTLAAQLRDYKSRAA